MKKLVINFQYYYTTFPSKYMLNSYKIYKQIVNKRLFPLTHMPYWNHKKIML